MFYDAMDRLIKTKMPDDTLSRMEFDSWQQTIYDPNDTILESQWYRNRTNRLIDAELLAEGKDPVLEKAAADKAAKHANTPNVLHFDTLGRPVLSIEHNKNILTDADEFLRTKVNRDVEGNLRSVADAREIPENNHRGNMVMQYKYDMLGNVVYQNSMDAGQRWLLMNILGNPLRTWDERSHEFQYFYDELHRPLESKVIGGDGDVPLDNIFSRIIYGESLLLADRSNEASLQAINILGKPIKLYDTAGGLFTPEYDFKGQPKSTTRKLFKDYKSVTNWIDANLDTDLETDTFTFITQTDALGRITKQTAPNGSITTPLYNEAGLLNSETVTHINPALTTTCIKDIDYNEKGQRNKIIYGNDVFTKFTYDQETFRLIGLETQRKNNDPLQDWNYTFDPVGNITSILDNDIPVVFFDNQKITGLSEYTYDALYRLIEATGRENDAALNFDIHDNFNDAPFKQDMNPGDPMAVRNYTQSYLYDEVGNIKQMRHVATGNNWTRGYHYAVSNNRLNTTEIGSQTYNYSYHPQHGFIMVMPQLQEMGWNFKEELVKSIRQKVNPGNGTAETNYYQYDGQGQRIRKITENSAQEGATPIIKNERIYIAGYETFRTYQANVINFERESLSLMDQGHRFVMVETVKQNTDSAPPPLEKVGARLSRYQLHNYIGSAALELDDTAQVISYEEYHPYGTTAYQAMNAAMKVAAKRYRYTGLERDEETGLEYHNARYYMPWLGRWISCDPIKVEGGVNLFCYARGNPILFMDPFGKDVYILLNTSGREIDYAAVATRKAEIESRISLENRQGKDKIIVLEAFDLAQLKSQIDKEIAEAKKQGFGKTVELSEWGHGGTDGPVGKLETSGSDQLGPGNDRKQMKFDSWVKIDFNFDPKHSIAAFYGCNDFAKRLVNAIPDLQLAGGYDVSSFPSKKWDDPDWHSSSYMDDVIDKEMKKARDKGTPWKVFFVGQSWYDRNPRSTDTTYLKVVDKKDNQRKVPPNADIDLLNRNVYQVLTREKDRP
jgi:RHS repeat-associated protein